MKTFSNPSSTFAKAAVLVGALIMMAACASTRTQRSAGETVDDGAITTKVKSELVRDDLTKARHIEVETYRGVVQLNGFVDSSQEKARAEQLARNVTGVQSVRNNLDVKQQVASSERTPGEYVDDATLTAKVKAKLIDNPATKARQINVDTYEGVVKLSGFVDSNEEKRLATEAARSVTGVKEVRNDLEVKQGP